MGFWPTVLVNWTCPLCLCANKPDVTSPPANLVGLQGRCPPWKGSVVSWWEHMELSDQSAPGRTEVQVGAARSCSECDFDQGAWGAVYRGADSEALRPLLRRSREPHREGLPCTPRRGRLPLERELVCVVRSAPRIEHTAPNGRMEGLSAEPVCSGFVLVKFWPESCGDGRMCDILVPGGAGWEEAPPVFQEEEVKPEAGPAVARRTPTSASPRDSPQVAHYRDGLTPHGRRSPRILQGRVQIAGRAQSHHALCLTLWRQGENGKRFREKNSV
uniref:Uncharacterized protein n=1 Tax=Rangifer tarandus platyrhynchus TaxID=3082113 RepID=A0ACB0E5S2_RANTA|nr:unnamed protein product [Rangifer tarandus platyrhynchus]